MKMLDLEKAYLGLDSLEAVTDDEFTLDTIDFCRRFLTMYAKDTDSFTELEPNIYDIEEVHENCTVQVPKNSVTGAVSVGWWENE